MFLLGTSWPALLQQASWTILFCYAVHSVLAVAEVSIWKHLRFKEACKISGLFLMPFLSVSQCDTELCKIYMYTL